MIVVTAIRRTVSRRCPLNQTWRKRRKQRVCRKWPKKLDVRCVVGRNGEVGRIPTQERFVAGADVFIIAIKAFLMGAKLPSAPIWSFQPILPERQTRQAATIIPHDRSSLRIRNNAYESLEENLEENKIIVWSLSGSTDKIVSPAGTGSQ